MGDRRPARRVRGLAIAAAVTIVAATAALGAGGMRALSSPAASTTASPAIPSNCAPPASPGPASGAPSSPVPTRAPIDCTSIEANPAAGLADGQFVKVIFVNLIPGEALIFRQCIATWADPSTDCAPINTKIFGGSVDPAGGGSTYFPVYANANDQLKNTKGIPIACDAQHACAIVTIGQLGNGKTLYQTDITFAPSPDSCPPIGPGVVGGSGSAAATRAMYGWIAALCVPPQSLQATYITSNEHSAYDDLSKGETEFGVTGLGPYPPKDVSGGPAYKLAPLSASAVVIAYRAYDIFTGSQITTLTLTPDLIAQLFMGQINNFYVNRAIAALNPGIAFPTKAQVVIRAEHSSETYILTSWLKAVAPSTWKPPTSPSSDIFPATGIDLRFGERGAALDIVDPQPFDPFVIYIGAVDSSTAAFYGLPTVKIRMPDGSTLSANPASINKAISDMTLLPDGTLLPQWANFGDQAAWPMPNMTYMLAPTNTIDTARGAAVARFLRYAVQDGQKSLTGGDGYVPLPLTLVANSLAVADQIPAPVPTPSPSPRPSPSPTPLPSLPPLPSAPPGDNSGGSTSPCAGCSGGGGTPGVGGAVASDSRIATLSYSQGQGLAALARLGSGVPPGYALPLLIALAGLLTLAGVGLQLWAWRARPS